MRLYAIACATASGTLIASAARPSPSVAAGTAVVAVLVALVRRKGASVIVAAAALTFCLAGLRLDAVSNAALARGAAHAADAILHGRVLDDPVVDNDALKLTLGVAHAQIDGRPLRVRERVRVTIRPIPSSTPANADLLRVDARLHPLRFRGMDAAGRASARSLELRGVAARASVRPEGVVVVGHARDPLTRVADAGRTAVTAAAQHVPSRDRGLLLGVTIGDTSLLDPLLEDDFRTTGLSHVVAVSGANVAYVLALVAFILRIAGARRRVTLAVMAIALLGFLAITRFEPSVLRAGAMTAVALTARAIGTRAVATNALAAGAIVLQIVDPFVIFAPGFQLSALATLGLLVLTPRIEAMLPSGKLAAATAVTLGAQLAVAPLLVLHFHQLSLISVAANLLVVPAVAPATIAGMAAAFAGVLWHPLATASVVAVAPIEWMRTIAHVLAQLPLAAVGTPAGLLGLLFALGFTAIAVAIVTATRRPRPFAVAFSLMLVATGGAWARALAPPPLHGLVVTMLDVGQGDAFVVRADGSTMLIDGGADPDLAVHALHRLGARRVDLLVITHPHADHIKGLVKVAQTMHVQRAVDPYIDADLASYAELTTALGTRHVPRDRGIRGMIYRLGRVRIDILWPPATPLRDTPADVNNNSIVLKASYGTDSVLFAGEVQEEAQAELTALGGLDADALKVAHHGSRHMLPEFYAATHARLAMIPVGPNTFGHPAPETLSALRTMRIVRSDHNGEVSIAFDGRGGETDRLQRGAA